MLRRVKRINVNVEGASEEKERASYPVCTQVCKGGRPGPVVLKDLDQLYTIRRSTQAAGWQPSCRGSGRQSEDEEQFLNHLSGGHKERLLRWQTVLQVKHLYPAAGAPGDSAPSAGSVTQASAPPAGSSGHYTPHSLSWGGAAENTPHRQAHWLSRSFIVIIRVNIMIIIIIIIIIISPVAMGLCADCRRLLTCSRAEQTDR